MATPKKLPSGRWNVKVFAGLDKDGKQIRKSITADTKREAQFLAAQFELDRRMAEKPLNKNVKQALLDYVDQCDVMGYSPATLKAYNCYIRTGFSDELLSSKLSRVTVQLIQASVNDMARKSAPKTVKNKLYLLIPALKAAGVKIDPEDITMPKAKRPTIEIPEDDEVSAFIKLCKEENRDVYIAILLAALLGMRRSEICALEWKDVDFKRCYIDINKAKILGDGGYVVKAPKTETSNRTIPVPDELLAILRQYRGVGRIIKMTPMGLSDTYRRLRERHNFPYKFHSLRHYMVSCCQAAGIPVLYTMQLAGHSTPATTQQVYSHIMRKKKAEVDTTIAQHVGSLLK